MYRPRGPARPCLRAWCPPQSMVLPGHDSGIPICDAEVAEVLYVLLELEKDKSTASSGAWCIMTCARRALTKRPYLYHHLCLQHPKLSQSYISSAQMHIQGNPNAPLCDKAPLRDQDWHRSAPAEQAGACTRRMDSWLGLSHVSPHLQAVPGSWPHRRELHPPRRR